MAFSLFELTRTYFQYYVLCSHLRGGKVVVLDSSSESMMRKIFITILCHKYSTVWKRKLRVNEMRIVKCPHTHVVIRRVQNVLKIMTIDFLTISYSISHWLHKVMTVGDNSAELFKLQTPFGDIYKIYGRNVMFLKSNR